MSKNNLPLYVVRRTNKKDSLDEIDADIYNSIKKTVGDEKGLIAVIDSTHSGIMNKNLRNYSDSSFKAKAKTFTSPFYKPLLLNHDSDMMSIGKTYDARHVPKSVKYSDGQTSTGFIKTGIWIPETSKTKDHIEEIRANNYLTVSVGFDPDSAKCSICGQDHLNRKKLKEDEEPCNHWPGDTYNGKLCFLFVDIKEFKEQSVVNKPADQAAVIKAYAANGMDFDAGYLDFYKSNWMDEAIESTLEQQHIMLDINYNKSSKPVGDNPLATDKINEVTEMTDEAAKKLEDTIAKLTGAVEQLVKIHTDKQEKITTPSPAPEAENIDKKILEATDKVKEEFKTSLSTIETAIKAISDKIAAPAAESGSKEEDKKTSEDKKQEEAAKEASDKIVNKQTTGTGDADKDKKIPHVAPNSKALNKYLK